MCRLGKRQALSAQQIVKDIRNDLGIRLQRALVAEHLHVTAVGVVGRDLAVVYDGILQKPEGMRAAPPAGGIGRVSAVARPAVAEVLIQPIKPAHVLGEAHCLEDAHVLARRKNVRTRNSRIDAVDTARRVLPFVEMRTLQLSAQRREKVAVDERLARDLGNLARRDLRSIRNFKMPRKELFRLLFGESIVIKEMERVKILVVGIDPVPRKAAAQAVGSVMHDGNGANHVLSAHCPPAAVYDARDGAPGGNAFLSFQSHNLFSLAVP